MSEIFQSIKKTIKHNPSVYENGLNEMIRLNSYITTEGSDNPSLKKYILDKLYSIVTNKISKMDPEYQEILNTDGNYTSYSKFSLIDDTCKSLEELLKDLNYSVYKININQIKEITSAHNNLVKNKTIFINAFKYDVNVIKQYYFTIVSSIIYSFGFIVSSMIEFEQKDGVIDYEAIFKSENILEKGLPDNMLKVIHQFNIDIESKNIEKTVDMYKNTKYDIKHEDVGLVLAVGAVLLMGIIALPSIIRYIIYFFMHSKIKLSEYFEAQAAYLELNIKRLKASDIKNKDKIIKRQEASIEKLRRFACKLSGDKYETQKTVNQVISTEDKEVIKESETEVKNDEYASYDESINPSDDDMLL